MLKRIANSYPHASSAAWMNSHTFRKVLKHLPLCSTIFSFTFIKIQWRFACYRVFVLIKDACSWGSSRLPESTRYCSTRSRPIGVLFVSSSEKRPMYFRVPLILLWSYINQKKLFHQTHDLWINIVVWIQRGTAETLLYVHTAALTI